MSFNEKLQYLRKEKKLSQEQLANMLDVTRQSVSKWESGTTYPEMDKLIMLCKIFKCSLDDLTNDEITEINVERKETSNTIVYSFLSFIDKTVKMFQSMSTKEIIKCLFSMFIIGLILLVFAIPFEVIKSGFSSLVFNYGSNRATYFITSLFDFVLIIIFFVLYIVSLLYIFKVAYLDKYSFVSREKIEEVVTTKEPIREVKIVTSQPPKEDNAIFKALGNIIIGFLKFLVACFCFPVVGILLAVCFSLAIDIYLICNGIVFIGTVLLLIFLLVGCAWLLECASVFLFNRKVSFYRLLWTFIISIVGAGISAGICFLEMYDVEYIDHLPETFETEKRTQEKEYHMYDSLLISSYPHMADIQYVEDESMVDTVKVVLEYYDNGMNARFIDYSDKIDVEMNYANDAKVFHAVVEDLKDTLKNKEVYNYEDLTRLKMTVTSSKANITKIVENTDKEWKENYRNSCQYEIDAYESQISDYENRIDEYIGDIEDLQNKNEQLEEKVQELEEYKLRVQDILNE